MDNQNYDPINSQEVGKTEVTETNTTESTDNNPIINQEVEPAKTYDFMAALDVDYRDNPSIQKFKNVNEMAKSYVNLQGILGKEKAVIPQDVNDKEAMAEYMSKIGMPTDMNGYELNYNQEEFGREIGLDTFKQIAADNNMTQAQAQGMLNSYVDLMKSTMVNESEVREKAIAQAGVELRKDWGSAYNEKLSKAQSFMESNFSSLKGNNELMEVLGNNPAFIKDLSSLAGKFGEASIGDVPKQVTLTPADAKAERAKLMNSDAYRNQMNPEHGAVTDKARELLQIQLSGQA